MSIRRLGADVKCVVDYVSLEPSRKPEYIVVKREDFGPNLPSFKSWLLLAMWA